jgi:ferritin
MASQKIIDALNLQLNKEMFSSYLYLSMCAYFENKNLAGMSQWMKLQSQEEYAHAMKFYDFILRIGGKVKLAAIENPQTDWDTAQKVFEDSLSHEKFISKSIHQLMDLATEEKDHPTKSFLQWFVDEQVEEEDNVQKIVDNFELIGDSKGGLFMLDRELGARSAAPTAE